jgi:hypothetical protein
VLKITGKRAQITLHCVVNVLDSGNQRIITRIGSHYVNIMEWENHKLFKRANNDL